MPDNTQELDNLKRLYSCIMHDFHDGKDREDMWVREVGLVVNKRVEEVLDRLEAELSSKSWQPTPTAEDRIDTKDAIDVIEAERNKLKESTDD